MKFRLNKAMQTAKVKKLNKKNWSIQMNKIKERNNCQIQKKKKISMKLLHSQEKLNP